MNEAKAREILGYRIYIADALGDSINFIRWKPSLGDDVLLDGHFSADMLEAIVWWMRNKGAKK